MGQTELANYNGSDENKTCSVSQRDGKFYLIGDNMPKGKNKLFLGKKLSKDTFLTERKPEHFYKKYQGFGLNVGLLKKLKEQNVKHIVIRYKGKESHTYKSSVMVWEKYGTKVKNEMKPHDVQLVLETDKMRGD